MLVHVRPCWSVSSVFRYHLPMAGGHPSVTRLPLFPLPDVVCFPRTELKLLVEEPRYLRMVRDLMDREDEARWIGMVLLKPGWSQSYDGRPAVYSGGTASRLIDAETLPDGRSHILLVGDFSFELERELAGDCAFEELVNRIASGLDLPPLRKLKLLQQPLPERGLSILSILRNRQQVLDLLRPWRHLAGGDPGHN